MLEIEDLSVASDHDRLALLHVAAKDGLGERVLEVVLDRAAQRTRAVLLVIALLDEQLLGLNRELEGDLPLDQALGELRDLEVHDLHEVGLLQRPEKRRCRRCDSGTRA